MYVTTQTQHDAIAQASAKLFSPVYAEFRDQYSSPIDFYQNNAHFFTLTFNQKKVSLLDRTGLSTGRCFYQDLIDERVGGFVGLNSKNISELRHIASKHGISNFETLPKIDLIFAIEDKLGIKHQRILQRPIVAIRPKPHPLQVCEHLHFTIARACVGSNLIRKLHYQPIMLGYLDFEGTRYGASVDPLKSSWLHVHGMMLVRPQHADKFNAFMNPLKEHFEYKRRKREIGRLNKIERELGLSGEQQKHRLGLHKMVRAQPKLRLQGNLTALHDIKVERYNANNPLAELFGYSSKGADQMPVHFVRKDNKLSEGVYSGADDLFGVFPRQLMADSPSAAGAVGI